MNQFSHLKKLDVDVKTTAEMTLHAVDGAPVLILAPALESNKGYFNASLKSSRKHLRSVRNGNMTAALVEDTRDEDRRLYPIYVIKGWRNVQDMNRKDVPFSPEACAGFLDALPNWLFDEVREFAGMPANFVGGNGDMVDTETVAKNSKPG